MIMIILLKKVLLVSKTKITIIDKMCRDYSYTRSNSELNMCYNSDNIIKLNEANNTLIITRSNFKDEIILNLDIINKITTYIINHLIDDYTSDKFKDLVNIIDIIYKAGYNKIECSYYEITLYHKKIFSERKEYCISTRFFSDAGYNNITYRVDGNTISSYDKNTFIKEGVIKL